MKFKEYPIYVSERERPIDVALRNEFCPICGDKLDNQSLRNRRQFTGATAFRKIAVVKKHFCNTC